MGCRQAAARFWVQNRYGYLKKLWHPDVAAVKITFVYGAGFARLPCYGCYATTTLKYFHYETLTRLLDFRYVRLYDR